MWLKTKKEFFLKMSKAHEKGVCVSCTTKNYGRRLKHCVKDKMNQSYAATTDFGPMIRLSSS